MNEWLWIGAVQCCLNLLDSGADQVIHRRHRFQIQFRRRQAAHQYLERHRDEGPAGAAGSVPRWHGGGARRGAVPSSSSRLGPAVGWDGETGGQERDVGGVLAAHGNVDGWKVDRAVDDQWAGRVYAALL